MLSGCLEDNYGSHYICYVTYNNNIVRDLTKESPANRIFKVRLYNRAGVNELIRQSFSSDLIFRAISRTLSVASRIFARGSLSISFTCLVLVSPDSHMTLRLSLKLDILISKLLILSLNSEPNIFELREAHLPSLESEVIILRLISFIASLRIPLGGIQYLLTCITQRMISFNVLRLKSDCFSLVRILRFCRIDKKAAIASAVVAKALIPISHSDMFIQSIIDVNS